MTVVLLVGPDGTGKSTLATALADGNTPARREHYRPRATTRDQTGDPHAAPARSGVTATAKVLVLWAEQWRAHWGRRRRPEQLVIVERGFWDQAVDPLRYRLTPSVARLVRLLGRGLPKADLVVLLSGPPTLVAGRKAELAVPEIDRQLRTWRDLLPLVGRRSLVLDVQEPITRLASRVRSELERR